MKGRKIKAKEGSQLEGCTVRSIVDITELCGIEPAYQIINAKILYQRRKGFLRKVYYE
ncbi:hypothetical protein C5S29_09260 [ANME-1 cluster archaeon GoMg3.2]|nr:hypothetical protein [ANME-1 cluster archaeon GoMg3.2]